MQQNKTPRYEPVKYEASFKDLSDFLREWWPFVWERKAYILFGGFLIATGVFVYAYYADETYESVALIQVERAATKKEHNRSAASLKLGFKDEDREPEGWMQEEKQARVLLRSVELIQQSLSSSRSSSKQTLLDRYLADSRTTGHEEPIPMDEMAEYIGRHFIQVEQLSNDPHVLRLKVKGSDADWIFDFSKELIARLSEYYKANQKRQLEVYMQGLQYQIDSLQSRIDQEQLQEAQSGARQTSLNPKANPSSVKEGLSDSLKSWKQHYESMLEKRRTPEERIQVLEEPQVSAVGVKQHVVQAVLGGFSGALFVGTGICTALFLSRKIRRGKGCLSEKGNCD